MEAEKGSPFTKREREIFDERVAAAAAWLEAFAPEPARLAVQREALPDEAAAIDEGQRRFLAALADAIAAEPPRGGDAWQASIFDAAKAADVPNRRAFEALYRAFLGRTNGPRAGWLLASLEPEFVAARLRDAAGPVKAAT
jgi:lysyl-tRNA synthetase class 1